MICWYLCEAWTNVWFVSYNSLVSLGGMKNCTICFLWFAGICAKHDRVYDILLMICWYLCEAGNLSICCLWFAGICSRHEKCTISCLWLAVICARHTRCTICWYLCEAWKKKYDLLPMICWYLCEAWKMYDSLLMIYWYLREAWKDVRFVAYDLMVSVQGMKRCTICCLWFAGICARHEKMYVLLPMICWYLCEAWKDVRFVCQWFAGICARHENMYDLLPMICWYLCEAWKDVRFVAYDLLVSVRGMKTCTICCLWKAGICARHEKMYDLLPMICWYLCEAWKDLRFVAYNLLVFVRGMKRCTISCPWFASTCARHEKMYDLLPMLNPKP